MDLIRPDQRDAAALTLSEAFHDDPLMQLLAPDELRRQRVGRWFFCVTVDYGIRWGRVWVNDDATAVAVWLTPDNAWSAARSFRVGMGLFPLRVGPRAMVRVMRAARPMGRHHLRRLRHRHPRRAPRALRWLAALPGAGSGRPGMGDN